jgi:Spy/CpxP family protein refolding chaperone
LAQPVLNELRRNQQALRAATDGQYDRARVRALAARQGRLVGHLTVDDADVKAQIFTVLTADQRRRVRGDEDEIGKVLSERNLPTLTRAVMQ